MDQGFPARASLRGSMGGFTGIGAGWVCWRPEAIVKGPLKKCEGTAECFFIQKPRGPGSMGGKSGPQSVSCGQCQFYLVVISATT